MNVQLTKPELERYVDEQVRIGNFSSPEAVVEDALLRRIAEEVPLTAQDWAAIERADAQARRGQTIDFSDFAAEVRKKYGIT